MGAYCTYAVCFIFKITDACAAGPPFLYQDHPSSAPIKTFKLLSLCFCEQIDDDRGQSAANYLNSIFFSLRECVL